VFYLVRNYLHITQETLVELHQNHIDDASKIISIVRDVFNIVAISIAGIWAYYCFIKGRTFTPKIKVDIFLQHSMNLGGRRNRSGSHKNCKFWESRIRPLYAKLKAYSAQISSGKNRICSLQGD